jgi:hypothetical protein
MMRANVEIIPQSAGPKGRHSRCHSVQITTRSKIQAARLQYPIASHFSAHRMPDRPAFYLRVRVRRAHTTLRATSVPSQHPAKGTEVLFRPSVGHSS